MQILPYDVDQRQNRISMTLLIFAAIASIFALVGQGPL